MINGLSTVGVRRCDGYMGKAKREVISTQEVIKANKRKRDSETKINLGWVVKDNGNPTDLK